MWKVHCFSVIGTLSMSLPLIETSTVLPGRKRRDGVNVAVFLLHFRESAMIPYWLSVTVIVRSERFDVKREVISVSLFT